MKISLYNTILPITDRASLIYNALSDQFIALKQPFISLRNEDIVPLQTEQPLLFKQLTAIGAILEDNIDEIQILRQRIDEIDKDDRVFQLTVNPTLDCNFNCWYCYENHQEGSMMTEDTVRRTKEFIRRTITGMPSLNLFRLGFFGGEPLLGFSVVKTLISFTAALCEINNIDFHVSFTSNGFLIDEEKINFLKHQDTSFQITLDGSKEQHDNIRFGKGGEPSYDTIFNNIMCLLSAGIKVILRFNYTSDTIGGINELLPVLKNLPDSYRSLLFIDLQRVWQDKNLDCDDTYLHAKKLRNEIRKMGFIVYNPYILHGVTDSCYGDKLYHTVINYNGDTFRCTARDFKQSARTGQLDEDGSLIESGKEAENWMTAKFSKSVCHVCRIAPLCGGGCRKQAVEHINSTGCYYNYTKTNIDEFILERFEEKFLK